jgi:hypothetical protein
VILDLLSLDFTHAVAARGRDYQRRGAVRAIEASPSSLRAIVQGSDAYRVVIRWDDAADFMYECSCPYEWGACKHAWATILEANKRRILPTFPAKIVRERYDAALDEGLLADDDESGDIFDGADLSTQAATPVARSARTTDWRTILKNAAAEQTRARPRARARAATAAGQRLLYLVDLAATTSHGQGIVVDVSIETQKKDGGWGAPRVVPVGSEDWDTIADATDRDIARTLLAITPATEIFIRGYSPYGKQRFVLAGASLDLTLRPMCDSGRCRVHAPKDDRDGSALVWSADTDWELCLAVDPDTRAQHYTVAPFLRRGDTRAPDVAARRAPLLLPCGVLIDGNTIGRFRGAGVLTIVDALDRQPLVIPEHDVPELVAELRALPVPATVECPPHLVYEEVDGAPVPCVSLTSTDPRSRGVSKTIAALRFAYGEVLVEFAEERSAVVDHVARQIHRRNRDAERAAQTLLLASGFREEYDYSTGSRQLRVATSKVNPILSDLLGAGWHIELEERRLRVALDWNVSVTSGIDWFDLHASVAFGDVEVPLPALLQAIAHKSFSMRLPDGTHGVIPADLARRIAPLARLGVADDDRIRFTSGQAGFLDVLLAALPASAPEESLARVRDAMARFDGITPLDAPAGFTGTLRPYQREGLGWLEFLRQFSLGGCLADDMGLGKTVQVLALLERRREAAAGPSLVVVPRSLVFNWQQEAARFTPQMRVLDHSGAQRRRTVQHFTQYDLILTTYGTLRRDAAHFRDLTFEYVVLDEAQAIKNPDTESAKAARLLRARHRVALSGTPVQNHLRDLWSLFEFLNPGMLGTASVFQQLGAEGNGAGAASAAGAGASHDTHSLLSRALRPYILRRTKERVAPELPEKLEQTVYVDLDAAERTLYNEMRDHYRAALLRRIKRTSIGKSQIHILEALLRLRQAACHPGLLDKSRTKERSSKVTVLIEQIEDVVESGHKALVFSQFTSLLAIVRSQLDAAGVIYEYLDGATRDREARVARFQSDEACPLFLISLRAGGLGLNLTAADYVFLLDPWWNPAVETQAIDRTHRIGQTRRVFASRLIARDTVEERVLELQATKRALADAIIGEENSSIARIGVEELEMLLG